MPARLFVLAVFALIGCALFAAYSTAAQQAPQPATSAVVLDTSDNDADPIARPGHPVVVAP